MKNQIAQDAPNQTKQIRCKLTDQNLKTYNGFQWELGKKRVASGKGELCSSGWLHCYTHPLLAILLNPVHANIKNPRLFEIEVGGKMKTDNGLKEGWTGMALVKEIEIPEISLTQKIAFGILCSLEVYKEESYVIWAKNWLNNVDRTDLAAARAARAAMDAVAADADWAAADTGRAAARAAMDAVAADADWAAADTGRAAARAGDWAMMADWVTTAARAGAADWAARAGDWAADLAEINLIQIAEKSMLIS